MGAQRSGGRVGAASAPGPTLGPWSAFAPAPTWPVRRPFVETFLRTRARCRDGPRRWSGSQTVRARAPRKRWPFVRQFQRAQLPERHFSLSPLLDIGKNPFRAGKDSHSWYPLVTSTRILLLLSVTQTAAGLREGSANAPGFTQAPRPVLEARPAARSPPGITRSPLGPADTGN